VSIFWLCASGIGARMLKLQLYRAVVLYDRLKDLCETTVLQNSFVVHSIIIYCSPLLLIKAVHVLGIILFKIAMIGIHQTKLINFLDRT
jgi:hypothetical protein